METEIQKEARRKRREQTLRAEKERNKIKTYGRTKFWQKF